MLDGGSSLVLNEQGILAVVNTVVASVFCLASWMTIDYLYTPHRLTLVQNSLAIVSDLVAITPCTGYLTMAQATLLGLVTGVVCNFSSRIMHKVFKVDDVLDVFSAHAVGGIVGALLFSGKLLPSLDFKKAYENSFR